MRSIIVKEQRMKKADITKRVQEKRKGFTKKIGNTTYDVSFHYSRQSKESMNDKIIRLIENDMQGMKISLTNRSESIISAVLFWYSSTIVWF